MIRQQLLLEDRHVVWLKAQGPSVSETVRELVNRAMDGSVPVDSPESQIELLREEVEGLSGRLVSMERLAKSNGVEV
jgi:hypothetical protein